VFALECQAEQATFGILTNIRDIIPGEQDLGHGLSKVREELVP